MVEVSKETGQGLLAAAASQGNPVAGIFEQWHRGAGGKTTLGNFVRNQKQWCQRIRMSSPCKIATLDGTSEMPCWGSILFGEQARVEYTGALARWKNALTLTIDGCSCIHCVPTSLIAFEEEGIVYDELQAETCDTVFLMQNVAEIANWDLRGGIEQVSDAAFKCDGGIWKKVNIQERVSNIEIDTFISSNQCDRMELRNHVLGITPVMEGKTLVLHVLYAVQRRGIAGIRSAMVVDASGLRTAIVRTVMRTFTVGSENAELEMGSFQTAKDNELMNMHNGAWTTKKTFVLHIVKSIDGVILNTIIGWSRIKLFRSAQSRVLTRPWSINSYIYCPRELSAIIPTGSLGLAVNILKDLQESLGMVLFDVSRYKIGMATKPNILLVGWALVQAMALVGVIFKDEKQSDEDVKSMNSQEHEAYNERELILADRIFEIAEGYFSKMKTMECHWVDDGVQVQLEDTHAASYSAFVELGLQKCRTGAVSNELHNNIMKLSRARHATLQALIEEIQLQIIDQDTAEMESLGATYRCVQSLHRHAIEKKKLKTERRDRVDIAQFLEEIAVDCGWYARIQDEIDVRLPGYGDGMRLVEKYRPHTSRGKIVHDKSRNLLAFEVQLLSSFRESKFGQDLVSGGPTTSLTWCIGNIIQFLKNIKASEKNIPVHLKMDLPRATTQNIRKEEEASIGCLYGLNPSGAKQTKIQAGQLSGSMHSKGDGSESGTPEINGAQGIPNQHTGPVGSMTAKIAPDKISQEANAAPTTVGHTMPWSARKVPEHEELVRTSMKMASETVELHKLASQHQSQAESPKRTIQGDIHAEDLTNRVESGAVTIGSTELQLQSRQPRSEEYIKSVESSYRKLGHRSGWSADSVQGGDQGSQSAVNPQSGAMDSDVYEEKKGVEAGSTRSSLALGTESLSQSNTYSIEGTSQSRPLATGEMRAQCQNGRMMVKGTAVALMVMGFVGESNSQDYGDYGEEEDKKVAGSVALWTSIYIMIFLALMLIGKLINWWRGCTRKDYTAAGTRAGDLMEQICTETAGHLAGLYRKPWTFGWLPPKNLQLIGELGLELGWTFNALNKVAVVALPVDIILTLRPKVLIYFMRRKLISVVRRHISKMAIFYQTNGLNFDEARGITYKKFEVAIEKTLSDCERKLENRWVLGEDVVGMMLLNFEYGGDQDRVMAHIIQVIFQQLDTQSYLRNTPRDILCRKVVKMFSNPVYIETNALDINQYVAYLRYLRFDSLGDTEAKATILVRKILGKGHAAFGQGLRSKEILWKLLIMAAIDLD
jgi:hypothetical protein